MSQMRAMLMRVADRLAARSYETENPALRARLLRVSVDLRAIDDETIHAIEADEVKIEGQEVQTRYTADLPPQTPEGELYEELLRAQELIDKQRAVIDTLQARMEKIREAAVWR